MYPPRSGKKPEDNKTINAEGLLTSSCIDAFQNIYGDIIKMNIAGTRLITQNA